MGKEKFLLAQAQIFPWAGKNESGVNKNANSLDSEFAFEMYCKELCVLLDDNLLLSDDVNSLGELTNICAQVATIEGEDTCILLLILLDDRAVDTCSKVLEIIEGNDAVGLLDVVERLLQCTVVEFDTQKFGFFVAPGNGSPWRLALY